MNLRKSFINNGNVATMSDFETYKTTVSEIPDYYIFINHPEDELPNDMYQFLNKYGCEISMSGRYVHLKYDENYCAGKNITAFVDYYKDVVNNAYENQEEIRKIRSVFISHMHEDHAGSLSAIAKRFVSYIKTGEQVNIFMPEENAITAFKNWLKALHFSKFDKLIFSLTQKGEIYRDENITVSAVPTEHLFNGEFPSYAFVVETSDKKILYTGDLACDFHDYPQIVFEI